MAYLGNKPATGENNAFRILDDISSHVVSFNGSSASVVSVSADTITIAGSEHRYITGQRVTYSKGGGTVITGLTDATAYYVIKDSDTTIQLATTASNATNGVAVNLTGLGAGTAHTLTLAFDGTNTKFKPTYNDGSQNPIITRAAQLVISLNGVIQQPIDSASPSAGFGIDVSGNIIFSTAPDVNDAFWGHVHASNTVTFDISDNDIDNFTGDGSTANFNLSKTPPNNENILVTLDGVVQYPSDNSNTRAYTLSENELQMVSAPASGVAIQVRHIGFAGPTSGGSGGVTGFYGRTGNVVLKSTDNPVIGNLTAVDAAFSGNVSIAKTLTYMDVAHVDAVGIITAQSGIQCLDDLNVGLGTFFVDKSTGRVGIGTINPSERFHISALGASDEPTIKVSSENSSIWLRTAGSSGSFPTGGSGNDGELVYLGGDFRFGIGTASKNLIFFNGSSYNEAMRIDSSRRLLLGNTASRDVFQESRLQVSGATIADASISILNVASGTGQAGLILGKRRGSNGALDDGDIIGDITFVGYDGTDLNSRAAIIRSIMTADATSNSLYADLSFFTKRTASGYPTESLRIDSDGKVLIGITASTSGDGNLQSFKPTGNNSTVVVGNVATSASGLCRYDFCPSNSTVGARIECHATEDFSEVAKRTADLVFVTRKDGTNTEKVRITSDGKISQGGHTPSYEYDLRGTGLQSILIGSENAGGAMLILDGDSNGDGAGTDYASILHSADGNIEINNRKSGSIIFKNTSSETERLRITSGGQLHVGNATNNAINNALFKAVADDGEADNLYVGQFINKEATAGHSFGVNIQAGSSSDDHGFRVKNRANDTTQFLVRGDGNVGINSTAPGAPLDVYKSSGTVARFGHYTTSTHQGLDIKNNVSNYPALTTDGDSAVTLALRAAGSIQMELDSNNNDTAKYFRVMKDGTGASGTELFRVGENGRVGVGTVTPQEKLDVRGNVLIGIDQVSGNPGNTTGIATIRGHFVNAEGDFARLYFSNSLSASGAATRSSASIRGIRLGDNLGTGLGFWTNPTSGANPGVERLRIDQNGKTTSYGEIALSAGGAERFNVSHTSGGNVLVKNPTGANITFQTSSNSDQLQLHNGGNVGIGIGSPDTKLHVKYTGNGNSVLKLEPGTTAGNYGGIELGRTDGSGNIRMTTVVKGGVPISGIAGIEFGSSNTNVPAVSLASANTSGGHIAFKPKGSERVRLDSDGRLKVGSISDYSVNTTNCPVYIRMNTDLTATNTAEGDANTGLVRIEETGSNANRYHGIELRNRQSGDIRILNKDVNTSDRGDLILVMPSGSSTPAGLHQKMRINSIKDSIQIAGKGGAVLANSATEWTDIYISTVTGVTSVNSQAGDTVAGLIRFEDKGSSDNRFHGLDIRNRNSGDIRILNKDVGQANTSEMVFAVDNGSDVMEAARLDRRGGFSHRSRLGATNITAIHNGNGSGNWYSGSAPQRIYPQYWDKETGYGVFYFFFNPSTSHSGYENPTFIIRGGTGFNNVGGGSITLSMNQRTNSPANGTFRHYYFNGHYQIYNDGDTDQVSGQRSVFKNQESYSTHFGDSSTSVDYIPTNDSRYGTNTEPLLDQYSYVKVQINDGSASNPCQGHRFFCKFETWTGAEKTWHAYMVYNG